MAGAGNQPDHMRARKWHGHQVADGHTGLALSAVAALVTACLAAEDRCPSLTATIVTHLGTRSGRTPGRPRRFDHLIRSDLHGRLASAQMPSELAKPYSSLCGERRCCATLCGQNPANLSGCSGQPSRSAGVKERMTAGCQGIDSVRLPVRVPCQIRHGGSVLTWRRGEQASRRHREIEEGPGTRITGSGVPRSHLLRLSRRM
jgi:hypothetical protein